MIDAICYRRNGNPGMARLTRWIVAVHLLAVFAHMAAAIAFVTGVALVSGEAAAAYIFHARMAWAVLALGIVQALAVFNPALPALHWMYRVFAILVVIGEVLELFVIPRGYVVYHVTVAMVVWGCALALYVRMLNPQWTATAAPDTS